MERRWGWCAVGLASAAACTVTALWLGRWNLVLGPYMSIVLLLAALLAAGIGIALALKSGLLRNIVLVGTVVAAVLLGGCLWTLAALFERGGLVEQRVPAADGRHELLVVEGAGFVAIDPESDVYVRAGKGWRAQEALVWDGKEDGSVPKTVRFTGRNTIEIVADDGCLYRSTFDRSTLKVRPVHRVKDEYGC
ncbi:hypothetical protein [Actinomadura sp. 21ATH]|uniref:hypothetical protein n=1 Tax=Actinomadura sp. 21ATH TaxID=1735444 RepID=UPI0035C13447